MARIHECVDQGLVLHCGQDLFSGVQTDADNKAISVSYIRAIHTIKVYRF